MPLPKMVKIIPGTASEMIKEAALVNDLTTGFAAANTEKATGTVRVGEPSAGVRTTDAV